MDGIIHDAASEESRVAEAILARIENEGPLSRAMVAKKLKLSRTTLSTMISRFIDQKLVRETEGDDPQGRGRPGIPVDLDVSTWFALGAEFSSNRWLFALANLKGGVVATKTVQPSAASPASFLSALVKGIEAMRAKTPGRLLPAVGIGVPGLVNWESGTILRADDLGWNDVRVRQKVFDATGLSAYVLNRNRATGLAEARFGRGKNCDNFIYIGVGTGISAAIMLDGDLLHGSTYGAGEIGHMVIDPNGPQCRCGKKGCLQTMAAGDALAAMVQDASPRKKTGDEKLTGEAVCRLAMSGDPVAKRAIQFAASSLAMAVSNLITTINPAKFIIGGPMVREGPVLVDCLREEAERFAVSRAYTATAIEASQLGVHAGALGAACLVLRNKLELTLSP